MRTAFFLDTFPTLSETFLYTTIANLERAGAAVEVLARKRGRAPHARPFSARVRYLPSEDLPWLLKAPLLIYYALRLLLVSPRRFRRALGHFFTSARGWRRGAQAAYRCLPILCRQADVIYLSFGGLAVKYLDLFTLGERVCFSLRGSDINIEPLDNPPYAQALAEALRKAAGVHCVCRALQRKAAALAGIPAEKMQVIYTAVNEVFLKDDLPLQQGDGLRLVSVGRLDWRKGLEHGLLALRELRQRGIPCTWQIIGEGPYRTALEWAIRDMDLQNAVLLCGARSQAETQAVLRAADIYFHPAVHEGLSNSVVEAMAVGLPVVCSDVGGMSEALTEGVEGLLTPARDWRAAADALERLARDSTLRQRMGRAGKARALAQFGAERQAREFKAFLAGAAQDA